MRLYFIFFHEIYINNNDKINKTTVLEMMNHLFQDQIVVTINGESLIKFLFII